MLLALQVQLDYECTCMQACGFELCFSDLVMSFSSNSSSDVIIRESKMSVLTVLWCSPGGRARRDVVHHGAVFHLSEELIVSYARGESC